MSKYWVKTMILGPDDYKPWLNWHSDDAPRDGETFMARLAGTNRVVAARYARHAQAFMHVVEDKNFAEIKVWQWKSWKEFAEMQQCAWR